MGVTGMTVGKWRKRYKKFGFEGLHCEPPFFLYLEERAADFLIAVKHSRRKGYQVIRDRLTYGRRTPLQASRR